MLGFYSDEERVLSIYNENILYWLLDTHEVSDSVSCMTNVMIRHVCEDSSKVMNAV